MALSIDLKKGAEGLLRLEGARTVAVGDVIFNCLTVEVRPMCPTALLYTLDIWTVRGSHVQYAVEGYDLHPDGEEGRGQLVVSPDYKIKLLNFE